jgi:hypothetical protein
MSGLRARGLEVSYRSADLGVRAECAGVLAAFAGELPPVAGVWHAAGVHDDSLLDRQSWPRIAAVLSGKLEGALHLDALTRELELDQFVLFSSAFGLLGAPGLAGYVAANAGLDALAQARRADGLPALSIDWGPWAETGMVKAGDQATQPEWIRQGLRPMPAEHCLDALAAALAGEEVQVAIVDANWQQYAGACPGAPSSLIAELIAAQAMPPPNVGRAETPARPADAGARLRALPQRRQRAALGDHVATLVALSLGHDDARQVDRSNGFFAQGLDSLATLDLRNRIEATLGWAIDQRILFRYNSVDSLTEFLAQRHLRAEAAE